MVRTLRRRLDAELVRRGLAGGRDQAKRLIDGGAVLVNGAPAVKAATLVAAGAAITLVDREPSWASRAGVKLAAALETFGIDPAGARALDVGASTGGFTDVLLDNGASSVVALDVGYGQLLWRLQQDERVTVVDRTNFRTLDVAELDPPFDLVVVDVSFISVGLIAGNLEAAGAPGTGYVVLVKPQFEVGRHRVGRGGIVTDPAAHTDAVLQVVDALAGAGIGSRAVMASPVTGVKGNVEFLVHAVRGATGVVDRPAVEAVTIP